MKTGSTNNTLIIFHSQTGFTARYAQWMAEATGAQCMGFKEAKKKKTMGGLLTARGKILIIAVLHIRV